MRKSGRKKGFLFVEASLMLPVFLIGALTISSFIPFLAIQERMTGAFAQEAADTARDAYLVYRFGEVSESLVLEGERVLSRHLFEQRIRKNLGVEYAEKMQDFSLRNWDFLCEKRGMDGFIKGTVGYYYELPFAVRLTENPVCEQTFLFRAFVGSSAEGRPLGFEAMETESGGGSVWVFPRSGERFHDEECRIIKVYPRQKILTDSLRRSYRSCSVCHAGMLSNGSLVYCFVNGEVFHRKTCSNVEKYVVLMERSEAEAQGYSPCGICGG